MWFCLWKQVILKFSLMRTADGGAAVLEPGPGGARPPRGMAWQEELRMAPEVRRRRRQRATLQQGRATRDLLARAPAATAGGAGPPAGAAPAGRRRCALRSSSGAGPGRCAGAAAGPGPGGAGTPRGMAWQEGIDSPLNRVEDRVDLEGDSNGWRHGAQVGWGVKDRRKGGGGKGRPTGGLYSAESRHGAWRDSVGPKYVARLRLAMSSAASRVCQCGSLVTPKHVA